MIPINFPQANRVYAENQPEYMPLPACVTEEGMVITCWQVSTQEAAIIAESGVLWLRQLSFGNPLQPQCPHAENPFGEDSPKPQIYRHYKGGVYQLVSEAVSTDTKLPVIVYRHIASGSLYVRNKVEFHEIVDLGSNLGKVPRFALMGD